MDGKSLIEWLLERDRNLHVVAAAWEEEKEVEDCLAGILWDSTATFIQKCIKGHQLGKQDAGKSIQYISYPLFSQFKASDKKRYPHPWINGFPLFFTAGDKNGKKKISLETCNVMARYAVLYRGLKNKMTGFSFTGFAEAETFSEPRRCVVLDLSNSASSKSSAKLDLINKEADTLRIQTFLPASSTIDKFADLAKLIGKKLTEHVPTFDGEFETPRRKDFWKAFEEIIEDPICDNLCNLTKKRADELAAPITSHIKSGLAKCHLPDPTVDNPLDENLAKFCAWNHLLDFRKIIFIPYRTVEATEARQRGKIRSSSGVVIVMNNEFTIPETILSNSSKAGATLRTKACDVPANLIAAFKTLVDVATSRASIGDSKFYLKKTLLRDQAQGLYQGLRHESRNLHFTAGLAIAGLSGDQGQWEIDDKFEKLARSLDTSLDMAALVNEAFTDSDTADFREILKRVKKAVKIEGYHSLCADPNLSLEIPKAFAFVLAELVRNATEYGIPDKKITTKIDAKSPEDYKIVVSNRTTNTVDDWRPNRSSLNSRSQHGLDLVATVVEDLWGGRFQFRAELGKAEAIIEMSRPAGSRVAPEPANVIDNQDFNWLGSVLLLYCGEDARQRALAIQKRLVANGFSSHIYDSKTEVDIGDWQNRVRDNVTRVSCVLLFISNMDDMSDNFKLEMTILEESIGKSRQMDRVYPVWVRKVWQRTSACIYLRKMGLKSLTDTQAQIEYDEDEVGHFEMIVNVLKQVSEVARPDFFSHYSVFHFEDRRSTRTLLSYALERVIQDLASLDIIAEDSYENLKLEDPTLFQASNLHAARQFLRTAKHSPHIAIIDLHVEGDLKGYGIAYMIRKLWPKCEILIVSGHDEARWSISTKKLEEQGLVSFHTKSASSVKVLMLKIAESHKHYTNTKTRIE